MGIMELLKDSEYVGTLLHELNIGGSEDPIHENWIDPDLSDYVTDAFAKLVPQEMPYLTRVVVERNPDTLYDGVCIDANEKRMRYIVITVIPDTDYPYNYSYPLINTLTRVSLICWETIRATLAACRMDLRVLIASNPVPPILNNARIDWVSLYLGQSPYVGISRLSEQWASSEDYDGLESDVHLVKVREMLPNPVLQKMVACYEQDSIFSDTTSTGLQGK